MKHLVVYHQAGKSCHGPVNSGLWSWGDEIVVGFHKGEFMIDRGKPPLADLAQPQVSAQARTLDGGETWTYEEPEGLTEWFNFKGTVEGLQPKSLPSEGINFAHPNFAMRFAGGLYRISYDRCRTWEGPYAFPHFGLDTLTSRTSYIVNGPNDCTVFLSGRSASLFNIQCKLSDRTFAARTTDGGQTYAFLSWVVPEDPAPRSVQPSVVQLANGKLVAGLRRRVDRERDGVVNKISWIDAYGSGDEGRTWAFLSQVAVTEESFKLNGNPASIIALPGGQLAAVYGYRSLPWGMRLRLSNDGGRTWGSVIPMRNDGRTYDLGYPRSAVRVDGKVVSLYWISTESLVESHIAATIWDPAQFIE
jgi:BNR repeat-like domain